MATDAQIIGTYERVEQEHGGRVTANAQRVLDEVCKRLGLEPAEAKVVLIDYWNHRGAG